MLKLLSRLIRRRSVPGETKPVSTAARRLTQAHFGMMRAIAFIGGEWNSVFYCPWRVGRTRWESSRRRNEVHEVLLTDKNRARYQEYITRTYGPDRRACIGLCEDLTKRGFVEPVPGSGVPSSYALTALGHQVIGSTTQGNG